MTPEDDVMIIVQKYYSTIQGVLWAIAQAALFDHAGKGMIFCRGYIVQLRHHPCKIQGLSILNSDN
jgi:hypothetical protein